MLLAISSSASAVTVSFGNLTSNDSTNFITDTVTGREYLRFDAFNLSYADTVAAVGAGGIYEGYSIATSGIADDFYAAILGVDTTACTGATNYNTVCGGITGWSDGNLGSSYASSVDYFWYLSTYDTPGRLEEYALGAGAIHNGFISDLDDWGDEAFADSYGITGYTQYPINALLYKDDVTVPSTVPVPAAAWLFGSALLGFFGFSRRKANA